MDILFLKPTAVFLHQFQEFMLQVIVLTMSTDKRSPLLAWGARQRSKLKDGWLKQLRNKHASSAIPRKFSTTFIQLCKK
jgi:hypothetical protein